MFSGQITSAASFLGGERRDDKTSSKISVKKESNK
jgi:hypothetical protein